MKLYHGSKHKIDTLESRQAKNNDVAVPEKELLDGIYFTPDYGFALAIAATRAENSGITINNGEHKITLGRPDLFKPDEDVFIYSIDSDQIPEENLEYVDELQYVVLGISQIKPSETEIVKARKVLDYYELTNWKENDKEVSSQLFGKLK